MQLVLVLVMGQVIGTLGSRDKKVRKCRKRRTCLCTTIRMELPELALVMGLVMAHDVVASTLLLS
jgi:hypothetical protein